MSTLHGMPAHILLNHFIIVLAPLTALLAIASALSPAVRRRLIWLVLALAVVTVALTPLTVSAGSWLAARMTPSPTLNTHLELGDTTIYCSAALLVVAALLVSVHLREQRGLPTKPLVQALIGALVVGTCVVVLLQVYRIGESGARAAWGDFTASATR